MAKKPPNMNNKDRATEKRVSLTVAPREPGSRDIRVEITRNLSAKKRRNQRRFVTFLFVVMFVMLFPMAKSLIAYNRMNRDYQELTKHNEELKTLRNELIEEKESLYSPEMIERLAREELDMVMPGESKVYQAIPTENLPKRENLRSGEALH